MFWLKFSEFSYSINLVHFSQNRLDSTVFNPFKTVLYSLCESFQFEYSPLCISHKSMANESKRFVSNSNLNSDTDGNDDDVVHLSDRNFSDSKRPVTINIAPTKTGSQTVNIILTDGSVPKEGKETNVTESGFKLQRHRKRLQE